MATLYHYPFCPHSRFVRLVLAEMGMDPELREERPWDRRTEYLVDPATSAPIRLRISSGRSGGEPRRFTETRFTTYERLPLTAENARLLRIATKPDPKVITHRVPPPPAPRPR